jgi:hypothetical protein
MRKIIVMLLGSFLVCVATFTGVHAASPAPDRKVPPTEMVMHAPIMTAVCDVDTVATTHIVALQPALGPVAPTHLVAVDGGTAYLALIRSMTVPADRWRRLRNEPLNDEKKFERLPKDSVVSQN